MRNISCDGVSVLILGHALVDLVGVAIVASLTETESIHKRGNGDSQHEPGEGAHGSLGKSCGVRPWARGSAVHQDKGEETPEANTTEIVLSITIWSHISNVSSLLILVQLESISEETLKLLGEDL